MQAISTVERLDRPSTYYTAKVCLSLSLRECLKANVLLQKKRKYGRDQPDDRDGASNKVEEDDSLKDATTLYVGNLYVRHASI